MDDGTTPDLPLSAVVAQLRAELTTAMDAGAGQRLRLRIQDIELELSLAVTKGVEAGGGIKFWVLNAKGQGSIAQERCQRLRLRLQAIDSQAPDQPVVLNQHVSDLPGGVHDAP